MKLLLALPFLLIPSLASAAFPDVLSSHPNYDAINYVQSEGIVEGYSDGTYGPDKTINRAEFVKILVDVYIQRMSELSEKNPTSPKWEDSYCINVFNDADIQLPLKDVSKNDWYAGAVCTALSQELINGYPDKTFRPANHINFVEAAKILMNAFGLHTDVVYKGPWYELPVTMLQNQNAIPLSITRFDQPITRGEMAEMVYRLKTMNTEKESRTYGDIASMINNKESDWKTYENNTLLYSLSYPSKAVLDESPMSTEGTSIAPGEVISISYGFGNIEICSASADYPCGPTGVGIGAMKVQRNIVINNRKYTMHGWKYDEPGYFSELLSLSFEEERKNHISLSMTVYAERELTQKEYDDAWKILEQIAATLRFRD